MYHRKWEKLELYKVIIIELKILYVGWSDFQPERTLPSLESDVAFAGR